MIACVGEMQSSLFECPSELDKCGNQTIYIHDERTQNLRVRGLYGKSLCSYHIVQSTHSSDYEINIREAYSNDGKSYKTFITFYKTNESSLILTIHQT